MQEIPLDEEAEHFLEALLAREPSTDYLHSLQAMRAWPEEDAMLRVLRGEGWAMLVAIGRDVEIIRPLGDYSKDDSSQALAMLREEHPDKPIYVYGLNDENIERWEKTLIHGVEPNYLLSAQRIADLDHKKLRNAVTKIQRSAPSEATLKETDREDVRLLLHDWARRVTGASQHFQQRLLEGYLQRPTEDSLAIATRIEGRLVAASYLQRMPNDPAVWAVLVNTIDRSVNGLSEYMLWRCGSLIAERGGTIIDYGGSDPKESPGLHAFKKRFGWERIVIEYTLLDEANTS